MHLQNDKKKICNKNYEIFISAFPFTLILFARAVFFFVVNECPVGGGESKDRAEILYRVQEKGGNDHAEKGERTAPIILSQHCHTVPYISTPVYDGSVAKRKGEKAEKLDPRIMPRAVVSSFA